MTDLDREEKKLVVGDSPPWTRTTKTIVVVLGLLLVAAVAWRFQSLIGQIVTAAVIAYVLNPVIKFVDENSPLTRGTIILVIYFALLFVVIGVFTALGVAAYGQILNLIQQLPGFVNNLVALVTRLSEQPVLAFGPFELTLSTLDWASVRQQLLGLLEPVLSRSGQYAGQLASTTLRTVGTVLFIWVVSVYLALEIPRLGDYVGRAAQQPGYRRDAERLMKEFGRIWSAYLRGQIILGLVIGVLVGLSLGILGVQNALALGLLSGLLEFVPVVGPVIGAGAAMIVAFFQPTNYLDLSSLHYTLVVLGVMFVIQQLENNLLVPRIVGEALDLHPLLVILGVFMGASLAGILGAVLAAPVLASLKLVGVYAWRKLFDLPPFPIDGGGDDPSAQSTWTARLGALWQRLQVKQERTGQQKRPGKDPL